MTRRTTRAAMGFAVPDWKSSPPSAEPFLPDAPTLGATLDFIRLLWAVIHALQSRSKRMEAELGVTALQRLVLRLVGRFPDITAGALAELLHVHPSTLTEVFRRLVDRGALVRRSDPHDARRALFGLGKVGEQLDSHHAGTVETAVRRALARVDRAEVDATRKVLLAVVDELQREDR